MTHSNDCLASLRAARDKALHRTTETVGGAKQRFGSLDGNIVSFATNHPIIAVGGALATGVAAGLFLNGRPIRQLASAAGLVIFGPLIGDLSERLLRLTVGGDEDTAGPASPAA